MRRFSIRSLIALIIVLAVGLAALRDANELWAGMLLLVALAAVGFAVMGAAILRGKERYWWAGFAFFGGGYLALAVGPWPSDTFQPRLGTRHLLRYIYSQLTPGELEAVLVLPNSHDLVFTSTPAARLWNSLIAPGTNFTAFERVGHYLFALLAGLVGGMAAAWLYVRRESGGGNAESLPHAPQPSGQHAGESGG